MKNAKLILLKMAFIFMPLIFSLRIHAQALPTIDTSTFELISNGNGNLIDVGFLPQNLVPYTEISTSNWSPWNLGYLALSKVDINDCNISLLDDDQKAALLSAFTVVNVNGATVNIDDDIYFLEYDNGYFTGQCYVDSNGKMLAYSDDLGGHLLQSRFGGNIKDIEDWVTMYEDTALDIYSDSFLLTDHPEYINDSVYYIFEGTLAYGNPSYAYDLFIPNQYNIGVIWPTQTTNGSFITEWYYNSFDSFIFHTRYGNDTITDRYTITNGTFNINGVVYNHKLRLNRLGVSTTVNNDFFEWLNGNNKLNTLFALQGYTYNNQVSSSNTVAFKPIDNINDTQIFNYNYYYSYNDITDLENKINNLENTLNDNFNNQQIISENNFPYYYPLENVTNQPSQIPFPGIENYPGYEPMPLPQTSPYLSYDPIIQPTPEATVQSFWNFQIPFVQNLFKKYPFSIPWDIKNFFLGFTSIPQAPAWDFDYTITVLGHEYTTHFEGDLSDFEPLAIIFRNLITISFIIFLAIYSYFKHS